MEDIAVLFLLVFGLAIASFVLPIIFFIFYILGLGIFAVLCGIYYAMFPTRPLSREEIEKEYGLPVITAGSTYYYESIVFDSVFFKVTYNNDNKVAKFTTIPKSEYWTHNNCDPNVKMMY